MLNRLNIEYGYPWLRRNSYTKRCLFMPLCVEKQQGLWIQRQLNNSGGGRGAREDWVNPVIKLSCRKDIHHSGSPVHSGPVELWVLLGETSTGGNSVDTQGHWGCTGTFWPEHGSSYHWGCEYLLWCPHNVFCSSTEEEYLKKIRKENVNYPDQSLKSFISK